MVVAAGSSILALISFGAQAKDQTSRAENSAQVQAALQGARAQLREDMSLAKLGVGASSTMTIGSYTPTYTITDNSGSLYNSAKITESVNKGGRTYSLSTVTTNPPKGLLGTYYAVGGTLTQMGTRVDPTIDFLWAGSPGLSVPADYFVVIWTGRIIAPVTGAYTFQTVNDDWVRLSVDDNLAIYNFTGAGQQTNTSGAINLVAGQTYSIRMEFVEQTGNAELHLKWSYPGQDFVVIPTANLLPSPMPPVPSYPVSLSGIYNKDGFSPNAARTDGSFDASGHTYPSEEIVSTIRHDGVVYKYGPMTNASLNIVSCAGQTVNVSPRSYSSINMLVASSTGADLADSYVINYSDGTSTNVSKTAPDWMKVISSSEVVAQLFLHRHTTTADELVQPTIFEISIPVDSSKQVASIGLPNNSGINVFAITAVL